MKIELTRQIAVPVEEVWSLFDDVERVVKCMPGASLTKVVDENNFEGKLGMKVGPISVSYGGKMVIDEKDATARVLKMTGSGRDAKGAGTAQAVIVAELTEAGENLTSLAVNTDVKLTGRVASLGRGVQDVSTKVFEEFARRVEQELTNPAPAPVAEAAPAAAAGTSTASPTSSAAATPAPAARPTPAPSAGAELKVLPLLWSLIKDKVRNLLLTSSRRQHAGGKG